MRMLHLALQKAQKGSRDFDFGETRSTELCRDFSTPRKLAFFCDQHATYSPTTADGLNCSPLSAMLPIPRAGRRTWGREGESTDRGMHQRAGSCDQHKAARSQANPNPAGTGKSAHGRNRTARGTVRSMQHQSAAEKSLWTRDWRCSCLLARCPMPTLPRSLQSSMEDHCSNFAPETSRFSSHPRRTTTPWTPSSVA